MASGSVAVWVFEQLGGPKKKLRLEGTAAPFGRPRAGPVVQDGVHARKAVTHYPGARARKTRHIFGVHFPPFELHGRWSDRRGGKGFAIAKREEAKSFVADLQEVLITWGEIISVRAFIDEIDTGVEGPGEVEWTMKIDVDEDDYVNFIPTIPTTPSPQTYLNRILDAMTESFKLDDLALEGSIFESLDSLMSSINGVSAELTRVADQLSDFASAPIDLLRRMRLGMHQLRNSILRFRDNFEALQAELALENSRATEEQRFWGQQSRASANIGEALRQIAEAERAAAIAERGQVSSFVSGVEGDTWESISTRAYGDPGRASDIIAANSIPPGQQPIAGTLYLIPK